MAMSVAYGYDVQSEDDQYALLVEEGVSMLENSIITGSAVVSVFPFGKS